MTDSKIYIDTAPFIYYLEKNTYYFDTARNFFMECYKQNIQLVTSTVTLEEYSVYPFSQNDEKAVDAFRLFLTGMKIEIVPVNESVAYEAARIRAEYKSFKALDSIHLATAKLTGCTSFLTNDSQLRQMAGLKITMVEDLKSN